MRLIIMDSFLSNMKIIFLAAQRLARKPLGRLCKYRFIILNFPTKKVPTKTASRRPSRLNALVGRSIVFSSRIMSVAHLLLLFLPQAGIQYFRNIPLAFGPYYYNLISSSYIYFPYISSQLIQ
jgi:hypothetical protein